MELAALICLIVFMFIIPILGYSARNTPPQREDWRERFEDRHGLRQLRVDDAPKWIYWVKEKEVLRVDGYGNNMLRCGNREFRTFFNDVSGLGNNVMLITSPITIARLEAQERLGVKKYKLD